MSNFKLKLLKGLLLAVLCCVPLLVITGCGADSPVRCTLCGNDDDRVLVYASGSKGGIDFKSCVGPAGILGIGLNSKCWPTECVGVSASGDSGNLSGCIYYYNGFGCISDTTVKSSGKYSSIQSCIPGFVLCGSYYKEEVADTTRARTGTTCFGLGCNGETSTEPQYLNNKMPRSFTYGCWSAEE